MAVLRRTLAALIAAALALTATGGAQAQDYPNRPIKLVVAFTAGGTTDFVARLLAERLRSSLGQQPRDEIGGAAGGEGDHELDRPVGIVLRLRAARCRQGERGGGQGDKGAAEDGHAANNNDGPRDRHGAVPACDPRPRS